MHSATLAQTSRGLLRLFLLIALLAGPTLPLAPARAQGSPFEDIGAGLPGVMSGSADWGDYDNDGDLDILLTGWTGSEDIARVYRNDAGGAFSDIGAGLPGVEASSADWGDYDNDGDLDILLTGYIARVYRNEGGAFTGVDIEAGLPGVDSGSAAWGDYDNDGDLDVLLTGSTGSEGIARVYRNDGGAFSDVGAGLPGVRAGSAAWGDYDNDGDLDILLTGWAGSEGIARVYRNDAGAFSDIQAGLPGVAYSSAAWGDYDSDGDLDVVLTGWAGSEGIARVYRNDGGAFTGIDIDAGLPGVSFGSVAWGDYDNDGDLDVLLTGSIASGPRIARVYRNDGGAFTGIDIDAGLPGVSYSSAAWGDYDDDGDLDVLLTGWIGSNDAIARVYRNDGGVPNAPPTAPTGLVGTVAGGAVSLAWSPASDSQTPAAGLSYNLRLGTVPGGSDVLSPMADAATGWRRLPQLGNAMTGLTATLTLAPGTYYWSVQAVDSAFAGGPFADEGSFVITHTTYLPLALRSYLWAPDLVVESLIATTAGVEVVVRNAGNAGSTADFWVDVYVDPVRPPAKVNETWQQLCSQGLVWGVTQDLAPGEALTLRVGDACYVAGSSQVSWPLPPGAALYAQVDSANALTAYGAVLEGHEMAGGAYNNVYGPAYVVQGAGEIAPAAEASSPAAGASARAGLPPRPW